MPGRRALLLCGGEACHSFGILNLCQSLLQEQKVACIVYDKISGLCRGEQLAAAAMLAKAESCDFVLALGGGNVCNAGKALAFACQQDKALDSFARNEGSPAAHPPLPFVCIPTLADAMLLLPMAFYRSHGTLRCLHKPLLPPQLLLADPDLGLTVQPHSSAYHGLTALALAMGCMLALETNIPAVCLAATAWRQLLDIVPQCCANGRDENARCACAAASLMAAMAAGTCPCPPEVALAMGLCAATDALPLGVILSLFLAEWHDAAALAAPQRYARMASALGTREEVSRMLQNYIRDCKIGATSPLNYPFDESMLLRICLEAEEQMPAVFAESNCPLNAKARFNVLKRALL